jgi:hypothetical protein
MLACGDVTDGSFSVQRKVVGVILAEDMFKYTDDCGYVRQLDRPTS